MSGLFKIFAADRSLKDWTLLRLILCSTGIFNLKLPGVDSSMLADYTPKVKLNPEQIDLCRNAKKLGEIMKSTTTRCPIIAVANQKGGVGKTTTAVNLAQAFALFDHGASKVLLVDTDPQGNATQNLGIQIEALEATVSDLIRDRAFPIEGCLYRGERLDVLPANPLLARVEREMVGLTNSELRLAQRLRAIADQYSYIVIDTPPTFGPLMNSALNAADEVIVPIDSGYFALMGMKELLSEIEEIKRGTNPSLNVLGYLLTLADGTNIAMQTQDALLSHFGDKVFETKIRRSVKLKEAPALGKTIFQHGPTSSGTIDYYQLAREVEGKLSSDSLRAMLDLPPCRLVVSGGAQ